MKIKVSSLILYIAVLALLCFMLWFNHRRAALFFIVAMLMYLLFSLIMHIKNFPLPKITLTADADMTAGDSVGIVCAVSSHGFYPFPRICARYGLRHLNGSSQSFIETDYSIFHGEREYRLELKLDYCGVYEIVCEELLAYDFFGIFARRLECPKQVNIIVMPKETEIEADVEALGIYEDKDAYSDPLAGDDVSEIRELRDYREGDRLSQVHWKLSGKSEELIVKEYAKQVGACVALVCDSPPQGLDKITKYYELLYGFGRSLLEAEIFFELLYYSVYAGDWEKLRIDNKYSLRLALEDMFFYHRGGAESESPLYSEPQAGISRTLCITSRLKAGETSDGRILAANSDAAIVLLGAE